MAATEKVASFTDRYGDERIIHKTRHGLKVKREHATPILKMNPVVGRMIGLRIRVLRQEQGLSMSELAARCGIVGGHPKARMHEIEVGSRQEGLRLGTLYVFAMALGVEVCDLMPSVADVAAAAKVREVPIPTIGLV